MVVCRRPSFEPCWRQTGVTFSWLLDPDVRRFSKLNRLEPVGLASCFAKKKERALPAPDMPFWFAGVLPAVRFLPGASGSKPRWEYSLCIVGCCVCVVCILSHYVLLCLIAPLRIDLVCYVCLFIQLNRNRRHRPSPSWTHQTPRPRHSLKTPIPQFSSQRADCD